MVKSCILNFSNGLGFQNGQERLRETINQHSDGSYPFHFLFFREYSDIGGPHHLQLPYAFKFYSIKKALEMGYQNIFWLDSSMVSIKPAEALFRHLDKVGYAITWSEYNISQWTNDITLKYFNKSREYAEKLRLMYGGCMGFNTSAPKFGKFFEKYQKALPYLQGGWHNNDLSQSKDPKCRGHRHDMSIISLILNDMNMVDESGTFFEYKHSDDSPYKEQTCFYAQGM